MNLRKYVPQDLDAIVEIEKKAFPVGPYSRRMLKRVLKEGGSISVVAEVDSVIAGYAVLLPLNEDEADIETIAVLPEFHGKGISDRLMEYLEEEARKRSFSEIILEVREKNLRAISFYRRHGYEVISYIPEFYHEYYEGSRGAFRMSKALNGATDD
ncbi:MAG: ribosomal protein S18-alanine N-acetyltransferase [Thermoplasmataceae archaeon]|nr:ribosomal protein S18-alanine N-acetyltransferase [Candidatus Thermoplasmatota archaeon]